MDAKPDLLYRVQLIAYAALAAALAASPALGESPRDEEVGVRDAWVASRLGGSEVVAPFSFRYDGRPSSELLKTWTAKSQVRALDSQRDEFERTYTDPATGLVVRCVGVVYKDFPTVEWTVWFENRGGADTPILEDVQALDARFKLDDAPAVLHHARGSVCTEGDYEPFSTPLAAGVPQRFSGSMGRPSGEHWPYFNVQSGDRGAIVVVGWPAQWSGSFEAVDGAVQVRAGQELVHARLHPGESIRTPMMVLQFWTGDVERSQNQWRRWMIRHGMTRPKGSPPPPQFVAASSRAYGEMVHADEASQIMFIDRYLEEGIDLDAWWMDAGWYKLSTNWPDTGTWEVDLKRFPRGLRSITDHAHARGLRSIVWFEPERVAPGTWLYEEHPEWLLKRFGATGEAPLTLCSWSSKSLGTDPVVTANLSSDPQGVASFSAPGGSMIQHPGAGGESCVVRWTAPEAGEVAIRARFHTADPKATTDVHVLVAGKSVLDGKVEKEAPEPTLETTVAVAAGDAIDFVVGNGGNGHSFDSTYVEASVDGRSAVAEFGVDGNPEGAWSYGWFSPDSITFNLFDRVGKPGDNGDRLLNLGNPQALAWLTRHVSRLLEEQGIDLYRQDFNIDPLPFWRNADAPDRQGITENHHVVGYLAYWDGLIASRPGLLIDSCASGGRRNDLETMRRSVPLWRTDYAFQATGDQCMTYGLSTWIPYFGSGTTGDLDAAYMGAGPSKVNPYAFWSNASPSVSCGVDVRERGIDYKALRTLVGRWRELSRFYYDDFYRLTPYSTAADAWIAWQYDSPERGEGAVQAFRRPKADADRLVVKLRGLDADAVYLVSTFDAAEPREVKGSELAEGLTIQVPNQPDAAVLFYKKK